MQHSLNHRSKMRAVVALASVLVVWLVALCAQASPEAKILRVDPRAAQENGNPILTSVVEVSQSKRVSDATAECGSLTGNGQLDCMSQALEKPFALYTPFPFPSANAIFTVTVDGAAVPAKFLSDVCGNRLASLRPFFRVGRSLFLIPLRTTSWYESRCQQS